MLQLRSAYVDWPAALLVTASAAQLASRPSSAGRFRLAGVLFGGAVAIKVFALFAAPALFVLALRARPGAMRLGAMRIAAAALCACLPLAPWMAMEPCAGRLRGGALRVVSRGACRAYRARALLHALAGLGGGSREPGSARAPGENSPPSVRCGLPIEPFRSQRQWLQRAAAAAAPHRPRRVGRAAQSPVSRRGAALSRALVAAVSPVDPISHPRLSSLRGLHGRGTPPARRGFSGASGRAAGACRARGGRGVSGPLRFERARVEGRHGRATREEVLAARLPSLAFAGQLGPADRVVFIGENDRFHCPAGTVWRGEFSPVAGMEGRSWSGDAGSTRSASPPSSGASDRVPISRPAKISRPAHPGRGARARAALRGRPVDLWRSAAWEKRKLHRKDRRRGENPPMGHRCRFTPKTSRSVKSSCGGPGKGSILSSARPNQVLGGARPSAASRSRSRSAATSTARSATSPTLGVASRTSRCEAVSSASTGSARPTARASACRSPAATRRCARGRSSSRSSATSLRARPEPGAVHQRHQGHARPPRRARAASASSTSHSTST